MSDISENLKPCPFCGEHVDLRYINSDEMGMEGYYVLCPQCSAYAPLGEDRGGAIEHWNTRKVDKEIEELHRQIHQSRIEMRQQEEYTAQIYKDWEGVCADRNIAQDQLDKAIELIKTALANENHCPWCFMDHKTSGHQPDCLVARLDNVH